MKNVYFCLDAHKSHLFRVYEKREVLMNSIELNVICYRLVSLSL